MALQPKKILKRLLKVLLWTLAGILGLCLLVSVLIALPPVQRYITGQATSFLEKKLQTRVEVGRLYLFLPRAIRLEEVLVEEPNQDTLLYFERLVVRPNLWALLHKRVELRYIELAGAQGRVLRSQPDGAFNFDFILDAFGGAPDTLKTASPGSSWEVSIEEIQLHRVKAAYHDEMLPLAVDAEVGDLNLTFHTFSLEPLRFLAESVEGCDTRIRLKKGKSLSEPPSAEESPEDSLSTNLLAGVQSLNLSNLTLAYQDEDLQLDLGARLGDAGLEDLLFDLSGLALSIAKVKLQDNELTFDRQSGSIPADGFDPNHLALHALELEAADLRMAGATMGLDLRHLRFRERGGWQLDKLSLQASSGRDRAEINDLLLRTPFNTLRGQLRVRGKNWMQQWEQAELQTSLQLHGRPLREIPFFAPGLQTEVWWQKNREQVLEASLEASGNLDKIDLTRIAAEGLRDTRLQAHGTITHPMEDAPGFALTLDTLLLATEDLQSLLPDSLWPAQLALPAHWSLAGEAAGTPGEIDASAHLSSSLGDLIASAHWLQDNGQGRDSFATGLELPGFALGSLLADSSLGEVVLHLEASGTGLSSDEPAIAGSLALLKAEYQQHTFRNLLAKGRLQGSQGQVEARMEDPLLGFELSATGTMADSGAFDAAMELALHRADLYGMGFYPFPLTLQSSLQAQLQQDKQKRMEAEALFAQTLFSNDSARYLMERMEITAALAPAWTDVQIASDLLDARFAGDIAAAAIPEAMRQHLKQYFELRGDSSNAESEHRLDLQVELKKTPLLTDILVPELDTLSEGSLFAHLDSRHAELKAAFSLPRLVYAGVRVDSMAMRIESDSTRLTYEAGLAQVSQEQVVINSLSLSGSISDNHWRNRFEVEDSLQKPLYLIGNRFSVTDSILEIYLLPGELLLNGAAWEVADDNYLRIWPGGFSAHHLNLEKGEQAFSLATPGKDLEINFQRFRLQNLLGIMRSRDSVRLLHGVLDGSTKLISGQRENTFEVDLSVDSLQVMQYPVGRLQVKANNAISGTYQLDVSAFNAINQFHLLGSYDTGDELRPIDFQAQINWPDISFLNVLPLTGISQMEGGIMGDLEIKGSAADFDLKGDLDFQQTAAWVEALSTRYVIPEGRCVFDEKGIRFDRFGLQDPGGNLFSVEGYLSTRTYRDFTLDLSLKANNFLAVNSKKGDNELYYGTLRLNLDASLKGDLFSPEVTASLGINKGTDLTLLMPGEDLELITDEGVVVFVDSAREVSAPEEEAVSLADSLLEQIAGLDLTLNLRVGEEARFTVLVDPNAGDYLTLQGRANLVFEYDRSGSTSLSGTYEVASGLYQLSFYGLVKKQFDFRPGSFVTWSGDIMDATMDITATHVVRTTSLALVATEVAGSAAEQQLSRQLLPYDVNLNISGSLSEPTMGFAIDLPERYRSNYPLVDAKLNLLNQPDREAELNRQVFALLVMGSFLPEDPTGGSSSGANFATTAARNSVNAILTQQLNNLSNQYIKGFDLDFGLNSYNDPSSGAAATRTELNVKVSKKLLDERLTLEVGNRYDVEGKSPTQGNTVGSAEFAVIYELTPSGSYKIRAFRENAFDFLDGELQNTGIALIFQREFDSREELAIQKAERRKQKEAKKAARQQKKQQQE